jgi:hypothetical protein
MGCGSSSSPTAAAIPNSDSPHAPAVTPISLIAAAGRIMSATPARPVSLPLLQPAAYKHPTPLTMVGQKNSLPIIDASKVDHQICYELTSEKSELRHNWIIDISD